MPEVRKRRSVLSHPFRQRPRKGWGTQIWWWVNGWATTASYTLASNQVSGWSMNNGLALGYDAAGNVTSDGINAYQYDAEGRLCAVDTTKNVNSANPGYIGYIYDAAGTRVARGKLSSLSCNFATNGFKATTSWALGMGGEQVTEYAISGSAGSYASTWAHTNAFASGSLLATYHDADTYFALNDWLGNKRVEISAGGLSSTYRSLPFGNGLTSTGGATDATEHHFTGKERDAESGNDYFGARCYNSNMGRWMSPDQPFADQHPSNPQSWNLYSYTRNNPLRFVDQDGQIVVESRDTTYYQVSGATANEALANAGQHFSGEFGGMTTSSTNFTYEFSRTPSQNADNSFTVKDTVTSDVITLKQTVELPKWDGYDKASPAEQKAWDTATGQLKDHETQHEDINRAGADALDKALPGTSSSATGKSLDPTAKAADNKLNKAVDAKADANSQTTKQNNQHLDACTNHGTQGCK